MQKNLILMLYIASFIVAERVVGVRLREDSENSFSGSCILLYKRELKCSANVDADKY